MNRLLVNILLGVVLLLLPSSSLGAAICSAAGTAPTAAGTYGGGVSTTKAICLCNGVSDCDPSATAASTFDYDLRSMGLIGTGGLPLSQRLTTSPDLVIFERNLVTGCSADLTASFLTGPDADTLHTLGSTSAINAGTTRLVVDLQRAPLDRFLNVALTNVTDCTDAEILMWYVEIER